MKPHITILMSASVDGSMHPSRFTASPDGDPKSWSAHYERTHDELGADAWLVGRVTMAEMSKAEAHPPAQFSPPARPVFRATPDAGNHAIALDTAGKLHFAKGDIGGDAVIVLLGRDVPDSHLAELVADGVSYIVAESDPVDLAALLETLHAEFGIARLALEGGARVNGSFLAAGLVDEMIVLVAPALDAAEQTEGFAIHPGGLKGKATLRLLAADTLDGGVVKMRYVVGKP